MRRLRNWVVSLMNLRNLSLLGDVDDKPSASVNPRRNPGSAVPTNSSSMRFGIRLALLIAIVAGATAIYFGVVAQDQNRPPSIDPTNTIGGISGQPSSRAVVVDQYCKTNGIDGFGNPILVSVYVYSDGHEEARGRC